MQGQFYNLTKDSIKEYYFYYFKSLNLFISFFLYEFSSQSNFLQSNKSTSNNHKSSPKNMVSEEPIVGTKAEPSDATNSSRHHQQQKCCTSCHLAIDDRYIFSLMNCYWHEECLQCSQCQQLLRQTCFYKNGLLFCKDDYLK